MGKSAFAVLVVARTVRDSLAGPALCALAVAIYGFVFLGAGFAYYILTRVLLSVEGGDSTLSKAMGRNFKGKLSILIYVVAIPLAFVTPKLSCALYALVAIIWLIPDRRIEKVMEN